MGDNPQAIVTCGWIDVSVSYVTIQMIVMLLYGPVSSFKHFFSCAELETT